MLCTLREADFKRQAFINKRLVILRPLSALQLRLRTPDLSLLLVPLCMSLLQCQLLLHLSQSNHLPPLYHQLLSGPTDPLSTAPIAIIQDTFQRPVFNWEAAWRVDVGNTMATKGKL